MLPLPNQRGSLVSTPQSADALVTGTLGLACGPTADAMRHAVSLAREVRRFAGGACGAAALWPGVSGPRCTHTGRQQTS